MAKWSFEVATWTPTATADAANLTNNSYMALQGGSATQRIDVSEIYMGGQATSSSPTFMTFSRDSTVGATLTALTTGQKNAALDPATAALAAAQQPFTAATTAPQRSSTLAGLNLSFNAYGGIVRWTAMDPTETFRLLGNTASLGEASLSAYTGGTPGLLGSHIVYEPL